MLRLSAILLSIAFASAAYAEGFKIESTKEKATCTIGKNKVLECVAKPKSALAIDMARDRREGLNRGEKLVLSGAKFSVEGGRTNEDGTTTDGVSLPVRFDDATNTWKIVVGWSGKTVLRDLHSFFYAEVETAKTTPDKDHRPFADLLLDAVKLDLSYGYGRTAKSLVQNGRNLDRRSSFRVHAKYEVGLDTFWAHLTD